MTFIDCGPVLVRCSSKQVLGLQNPAAGPSHDSNAAPSGVDAVGRSSPPLGRHPGSWPRRFRICRATKRALLVSFVQTPSQFARSLWAPQRRNDASRVWAARIAFPPARRISMMLGNSSEELGYTTVSGKSLSSAAFSPAWEGRGAARGRQYHDQASSGARCYSRKRSRSWAGEAALIFCEGLRPIRARKIPLLSGSAIYSAPCLPGHRSNRSRPVWEVAAHLRRPSQVQMTAIPQVPASQADPVREVGTHRTRSKLRRDPRQCGQPPSWRTSRRNFDAVPVFRKVAHPVDPETTDGRESVLSMALRQRVGADRGQHSKVTPSEDEWKEGQAPGPPPRSRPRIRSRWVGRARRWMRLTQRRLFP